MHWQKKKARGYNRHLGNTDTLICTSVSAHINWVPPYSFFFHFLVFTCSGDSTVKVFESKSGTCKRTFTGHCGPVNCFTVSLTNNFKCDSNISFVK